MTTIYTSKSDYEAIIRQSLGEYASEFDIDAIAYEMLDWHDEIDEQGNINLNKSGFQVRDGIDFWTVVEKHSL